MRFIDFRLVPPDGGFHPAERVVGEDPTIHRVAIHQFRTLDDGTAVAMFESVGDAARAAELLEAEPSVHSFDIATTGGDRLYSHCHVDVGDGVARVFGVAERHELVLDMPMRYAERGGLEIRAVGEYETFRDAMEEIPERVEFTLLRTGEYAPGGEGLFQQLTSRQQETLRTAVEVGYYQEPRRVTYQDIADRLHISAGTVGEHLRKIEAKILTNVVPERQPQAVTDGSGEP
jgi:DNA-binding CsgD family transcriptional regulator